MIVAGFVDRPDGRTALNCVVMCMLAAVGLVLAGATHGTWWSIAALSVATIGFYGMKPAFWPMPSLFLTGAAAAAGIAWINALGNLAGTITPWVVGTIKDATGSFGGGLFALAAFALMSAIVTLIGVPTKRSVRTTAATAPAE